mmetsp:Transcript_76912/g.89366  ORF Transcript_76912/g.89366 Transcript_76912/m.89366 type:complete len:317 (-) Transcript_76912:144-1094(-)|eukprot:CAMPEP_0176414896 /NCGR_PEP_ID=MMETSP0127-20121128/5512_1 /TAXON_ID=938130 /ORGANISM="Platyophrya macrostoma, Strain WH" /LENGTH=316 /DNA_ID=CAMNT_0017794845 /DNA_START=74 /DNA_END=1024 /DNA_ORIENTATION=+
MRRLIRPANIPDTEGPVDGEPFYMLQQFKLDSSQDPVYFRSFDVLPPSDAVGLLSGEDQTGLVPWEGTLRMLQWMRARNFITTACLNASSVVVVELGCGCGMGSVGVAGMVECSDPCVLESTSNVTPPWHIVASDGNHECVALANRNADLWKSHHPSSKHVMSITAVPYVWSQDDVAPLLRSVVDGACVIVAAGDVIYCPEMVQPLFDAILEISNRATSLDGIRVSSVRIVFMFVPRSLTSATNQSIYESILLRLRQMCSTGSERTWIGRLFPLSDSDSSTVESTTWCAGEGVPFDGAPLSHTACLIDMSFVVAGT